MIFDSTKKLFGIGLLAAGVAIVGPLARGGSAPPTALKESFRVEMLRLINKDRAAFGVPPVELDPSLSSFADAYCEKQIRNRTTGHFTLDGEPPYMRYSLAGGNDGLSENAAAWSANYHFSDSSILDMIRTSERSMMSEVAPHDGHRRTLLDPDATHVGLGVAWEGGELRIVQEFVRRYVSWTKPLPRTARVDDRVSAEGRALPGSKIEAVSVHYEPMPQEMSAQLANAIDTYGLPKLRRDYYAVSSAQPSQPASRASLARAARQNDGLRLREDGSFTFPVPFTEGPGLYTVVVWVSRGGKAVTASNVSIRVDGAPSITAFPLGSR